MSIIAWNVRGMISPQLNILDLPREYKTTIVALVENKMNDLNIEMFFYKLPENRKYTHNNECEGKGRILLLWGSNIQTVNNIDKNMQFIDRKFNNAGGLN